MIVFDLRCMESGDVFEGWFQSGADYQEQSAKGLIQCPFCESSRIEKAPMAPSVPRRSGSEDGVRTATAQLAALQSKLLQKSDWVGDAFPDRARAMHLGEIEARPVHGRASAEEAKSLADEGGLSCRCRCRWFRPAKSIDKAAAHP